MRGLRLITLGQQQTLDTLYERHARRVVSLALHITADRLSADEVPQDVFVLVWQRPTAFGYTPEQCRTGSPP